jgi:K+ transporter
MTGNIATVPVALLHNLKHNRILHEACSSEDQHLGRAPTWPTASA